MDERLAKALDYSNYMVTYNNQKLLAKERFNENLCYFFNGSQFIVSIELINYVHYLFNKGITNTILIDSNETPIKIDNIEEFLNNIQHTYFFATNRYYQDLTELKTKRKVEKLVE